MKQPNIKYIPWDDNAPHQIRLIIDQKEHRVGVSCTCLRVGPIRATTHYDAIGYFAVGDMTAAWRLFNDPSNHKENAGQAFRAPDTEVAQDRTQTRTTT